MTDEPEKGSPSEGTKGEPGGKKVVPAIVGILTGMGIGTVLLLIFVMVSVGVLGLVEGMQNNPSGPLVMAVVTLAVYAILTGAAFLLTRVFRRSSDTLALAYKITLGIVSVINLGGVTLCWVNVLQSN
ncbi:MAG: hypothetical protein OHK0029_34490 [Armatimonadaceae bacterium]